MRTFCGRFFFSLHPARDAWLTARYARQIWALRGFRRQLQASQQPSLREKIQEIRSCRRAFQDCNRQGIRQQNGHQKDTKRNVVRQQSEVCPLSMRTPCGQFSDACEGQNAFLSSRRPSAHLRYFCPGVVDHLPDTLTLCLCMAGIALHARPVHRVTLAYMPIAAGDAGVIFGEA